MIPRRPTFAVVLLGLAAAGCTSTMPSRRPAPRLSADPATRDVQIAALRTRERQAERLVRVGDRVLFAGAPLCGSRVVRAVGFVLWNADSAGPGRARLMRTVFGLDRTVRVRAVGDRSPAARAGLEVGDTLVAVGDTPVTAGPKAVHAAIVALRRLNKAGQPYRLTVRRDGGLKELTVTPRPRCDYSYRVAGTTEVNAWTNGSTIMVSSGMMRFAETDTELAVVFGHELAHNVRHHLTKSRVNSVAASTGGTVIDIVLGTVGIPTFGVFATVGSALGGRVYSKAWEREADRVGLYFAARAGYDVDKAQLLWRRLAVVYGGDGQFSGTHPSYAERIVDVNATAREIDAKRAKGEPLTPDD